jgi:hypothetical protein
VGVNSTSPSWKRALSHYLVKIELESKKSSTAKCYVPTSCPANPVTDESAVVRSSSTCPFSCTAFVTAQRTRERASERAIVADCFRAFALRDIFRDRGISGPAVHVGTGAGVRDMLQIPSRLMLVCCCLTVIITSSPLCFRG